MPNRNLLTTSLSVSSTTSRFLRSRSTLPPGPIAQAAQSPSPYSSYRAISNPHRPTSLILPHDPQCLRTTQRDITRYLNVRERAISTTTPLSIKNYPPRPTVKEDEIEEVFLKGSGPGGQKINKTNSAVQLRHIPSGLVVKSQATRSREQNRKIARRILGEKLEEIAKGGVGSRIAVKRSEKARKKDRKGRRSRRKYRELRVEVLRGEYEEMVKAEGGVVSEEGWREFLEMNGDRDRGEEGEEWEGEVGEEEEGADEEVEGEEEEGEIVEEKRIRKKRVKAPFPRGKSSGIEEFAPFDEAVGEEDYWSGSDSEDESDKLEDDGNRENEIKPEAAENTNNTDAIQPPPDINPELNFNEKDMDKVLADFEHSQQKEKDAQGDMNN